MLALTMGNPAGIGGEIAGKAWHALRATGPAFVALDDPARLAPFGPMQAYQDVAEGVMAESPDGGGRFTEVVLQPEITVPPGTDLERARTLHADARRMCFIANSVNFPVRHEPVFVLQPA